MAKKGDLVVYERSDRPIYVFGSKVKPADEKSRKSYDVKLVTSATKEGKVKATQDARYAQPGVKGTPVDKWRPEPALTIPAERLGDIGGIKQALENSHLFGSLDDVRSALTPHLKEMPVRETHKVWNAAGHDFRSSWYDHPFRTASGKLKPREATSSENVQAMDKAYTQWRNDPAQRQKALEREVMTGREMGSRFAKMAGSVRLGDAPAKPVSSPATPANGASASKRYVTLGSGRGETGRKVGLGTYVKAWKTAKGMDQGAPVRGTPSDPTGGGTAGDVVREMRDGMHDRINRHDPQYGKGRKWQGSWQADARRLQDTMARKSEVPAGEAHPVDLRRRVEHRLAEGTPVPSKGGDRARAPMKPQTPAPSAPRSTPQVPPMAGMGPVGWSDAARAKSAEVRGEKAVGKPEPRGMDGLTRSERAARDGKAKPVAVTAAPAEGATSMERFRSSYEATLRKQVEANPGKYGYGVDRVPEMAQKMTEALAKGAGDHTSPTVKAVVKSLGIKPTVGGLKAFLNDQPPPAPRPQKSPLEKAQAAATKAEAERMKAWKGMQAGHVLSPDYVKAAQAAEAARKALESAKAHPTTVISAGIRDSSGSLHVKNPDTNTWSVDKSAPKQIAPKGEISVPGDKGKVQKPRLSNPDVKALLKEGVITKDDVKRSKTMDDVRSIADRSRANRNADRGIDRPAPRPLSPMEQAAKNATFPDVPKVAEAAKGAGTPVPPKPSSGLRGTQNEANKAAIIENRKGKAKGKAKASNPNVEAVRTLSATAMGAKRKVFAGPTIESALATEAKRVQMAKDAVGVGAKPASTGKAPEVQGPPYYREVINRRNGIQSGTKMVKVPPKAPKPAKPGTKALGLLAPVALGTAMLAGANKAKAEGLGTAAQIKEAGKEGGKAAVTMGAFTVGTVGAVKGLMKLGMTAGRALPLVNAGMMVGGAIHGAVTAKPGERLAGAARGAWDMSLPGMVVNTASAAKEAVQGRVGTSPSTGGHDMGASFAQANQRYQAMREAAATTDPADKRKGWSNAARIAAAKARGASNLPYGGDAAAGPSQYAPK